MDQSTFILWLQSFRSPAMDAFWLAVTWLGEEEFFLLAIPILYWCVDAALTVRLSLLFFFSILVNSAVKDFFQTPRPTPQQVQVIGQAAGFAFPSGHAQGNTVFWGFLAAKAKARWFPWLAVFLILLVGISRLYLGVHWPVDVIGGWGIGLVILGLGLWAYNRWERARPSLSLAWQLGLAVTIPTVLFLFFANPDSARGLGAGLGVLLGYVLLGHYVGQFPLRVPLWQQGVKLIIGFGGLVALRFGLKPLLPAELWADYLRYAALGFWAALLAPWLFKKLLGESNARR